ncbi:uncharacterized protein L201_003955 [Kwoniella dendrophila CBS 6074]|uniref:Uncharacterized protein n=1 Tax=Kwoniella dendrophila CBS 6074 TaxID=1295534 RepID=A0AAX4JWP3_9TREE
MRSTSVLLFSLLPLLAQIKAQDEKQGENGGPDLSKYPEWITNDYQCVIGCLSGFNDTINTIPQPDMEGTAYTCAQSKCAGDGTGNYYQTLYYIQLFYATGSIYEWSDSAPDGYKHATFSPQDAVQASASLAHATATDPWSADAAEKTGGNTNDTSPTGGVTTAPGVTGVTTSASSAKSASVTSSAAQTSGSSNLTGNGIADSNSSSGALPVHFTGLAGLSLQTLVELGVGVLSIAFGGVVTGL